MWECGLKLKGIDAKNPERVSLPMWECGLKLTTLGIAGESLVTPHVGVWIETTRTIAIYV